MEDRSLYDRLIMIQAELRAPKGQYNKFGKYSYRSSEDILEALKPLLKEQSVLLTISDEIIHEANSSPVQSIEMKDESGKVSSKLAGGDRFYVKATVTVHYREECLSVSAFAREEDIKKGMDSAQITGAASSYARKYALNGLFAIDDNKDADSQDNREQTEPKTATTNKAKVEWAKPWEVKNIRIIANKITGLKDQELDDWIAEKLNVDLNKLPHAWVQPAVDKLNAMRAEQ